MYARTQLTSPGWQQVETILPLRRRACRARNRLIFSARFRSASLPIPRPPPPSLALPSDPCPLLHALTPSPLPLCRSMALACANCGRTHISTVGAVVDGRNVFCNVDCAWSYRFRLAAAVSSARAVAAVEETTAAAAAVVAAATAAASSRRRRTEGGGRKGRAAGGGASDGQSTAQGGLPPPAPAYGDAPVYDNRRRGECVVHTTTTCGRHFLD